MSSSKSDDSSPDSGNDSSKATDITTLEADITQLSSLLSQETLDGNDEANVAELLCRLESADGMARGVESRLDIILDNLDNLLATLEPKGNTSVRNSDTKTDQPPANPSNHDDVPVTDGKDVDL
jgi:hypothetical protein